jgi:cell division protein FtsI/penicillin-binding protein 2
MHAGLGDGRLKRRVSYDQLVQFRANKVLYLLVAAYVVLLARLFYIQVLRGPDFKAKANALTVRTYLLPARRGAIYDCNGVKLAVSVDAVDVGVRPNVIKDKVAAVDKLSAIIGCDRDQLLLKFSAHPKFFYIAHRLDMEVGNEIRKANIPGIDVFPSTKRVYSNGTLAAHILGFTSLDGKGVEGVEKRFDKELSGRDGYEIAEKDARGAMIPGTKKERVEPINGKDIILTIDSVLQHSVEKALADKVAKFKAVGASAIIMDPKSGAILALANVPTFNPGDTSTYDPDACRNRALTDLYEPGSTLKTITACAGLESKAITVHDTFYCGGHIKIGRHTVRCELHGRQFAHGHGVCTISKILRYSCNIGALSVGFKLGKYRLHDFESRFGMYEKPGSDMPGEVSGWPDPCEKWADIHLANVAFGQGIAVTSLQVAKAYTVVANGGLLMRPYVVKEIRNGNGKPDKIFGPHAIRRVISSETAALVSQMLVGVVSDGTGKTAQVDGYRIAGKTGSAQKASTKGRGYANGKFVASFVGFLPISDPRVVILVAVDEPQSSHHGATVAAPVFQEVAKKTMWHMGVPPDQPDETQDDDNPAPKHHKKHTKSEKAEHTLEHASLDG